MTKEIMIFATAILISSSVACSTDNANIQNNSNQHLSANILALAPIFEPSEIQSTYAVADNSWRIRLVTEASENEVKEFYKNKLSNGGFELTNDFSDGFSTATGLHRGKNLHVHTIVNKSDYFKGVETGKIVVDLAITVKANEGL